MRVSASAIVPVQSSGDLRPDVLERAQQNKTGDQLRGQVDEAAIRAFAPSEPHQELVSRPVTANSDTREVFSRRQALQATDQAIPQNVRKALAAFTTNAPTAEQRLGIELASIDIFA